MEAKVYTQAHSTINGRGVWHYLIDTPIGYIHIVEYEQKTMELKRFLFDGDNDAAERKYNTTIRKMLKGEI